ncbi:unnamed protein product [Heligmosomoides polygyrus]|uniref:HTH_48 domain-containing protein n=1 Tax=Heligmosomoides polygyrus TaxID=6339 RepID=A0A183G5P6_HELPZ|nr:unnamed protein product [Heligmosomoides polygyrus]
MIEQKYRVLVCLLDDFKQGIIAAEPRRVGVIGNGVPSLPQCQRWFQRFRDGDESSEDEKHQWRLEAVDSHDLTEAVESDPTQTTRELAQSPRGSWVAHQLGDTNKAARIATAGILTRKTQNGGFYDSIVTSDEKWIHCDNTTRKRQWLSPGEVLETTSEPDFHGKEVKVEVLCAWWNSRGLVHFEVLVTGQPVTADLYKEQLSGADQALRQQGVNTEL